MRKLIVFIAIAFLTELVALTLHAQPTGLRQVDTYRWTACSRGHCVDIHRKDVDDEDEDRDDRHHLQGHTPEPGTFVLLGTSLVTVGWWLRKRWLV